MNVVPLDQLSHEIFARALQARFRVGSTPEASLELELCEVSPLRTTPGPRTVTYEQFALLFRGPADRILPQQLYWFESTATGRFELFIVPVSRQPDGIRYEAAFNRLVKPA